MKKEMNMTKLLTLLAVFCLLSTQVQAEKFSTETAGGTVLFVMQGFDDTTGVYCTGSCKIRTNLSGDVAESRRCQFIIDGVERSAKVIGGYFRVGKGDQAEKYAAGDIKFTVRFVDDGSTMTFKSYGFTQWAYHKIENNIAVAINGFIQGIGQWTSGTMHGTWEWQWSSPGGRNG